MLFSFCQDTFSSVSVLVQSFLRFGSVSVVIFAEVLVRFSVFFGAGGGPCTAKSSGSLSCSLPIVFWQSSSRRVVDGSGHLSTALVSVCTVNIHSDSGSVRWT